MNKQAGRVRLKLATFNKMAGFVSGHAFRRAEKSRMNAPSGAASSIIELQIAATLIILPNPRAAYLLS